MDRPITDSSSKRKKNIIRSAAVVAILGLVCSGYIFQSTSTKRVARNALHTTTVMRSDFQEIISFPAVTEPVNSMDVVAIEGGKVQAIYVQNGDMVKKGDLLFALDNPELKLEFMTRETQMIEQINHLRNARITLASAQKADEEALIDLRYQLDQIALQFAVDTVLFEARVIAKKAFDETTAKQHYYEQKKTFLSRNFDENNTYRAHQLAQIDASIALMERNLQAITHHLEHLVVRAPYDGVLTQFFLRLGESVAKNQTAAKIEEPHHYKAVASIDEHYLNAVKEGQSGTFRQGDKEHTFTITRIFPTVSNAAFRAEVAFDATLSAQMTKGQTLHLKLPISEERTTLVVEKGDFYHSASGVWAYVLRGDRALRQPIRIGKQNDRYYEVTAGLQEGDIIINSSYASFEDAEELILQ